jgi:hypothetical protein
VAQQNQPNPIGFTLPDGTNGRAWLASDKGGPKVGDDLLWRVNIEELLRRRERRPKTTPWAPTAEALRRPIIVVGRNDPVRDTHDSFQSLRGFKVRICIEGEKELQVLGCGWRIVTLSASRKQSASSPQWQHRHDEAKRIKSRTLISFLLGNSFLSGWVCLCSFSVRGFVDSCRFSQR